MAQEILNWNIDYGLASLFVLAVLLIYNIFRRELPLKKALLFNILLITIALADILDIFSNYFDKHPGMFSFPVVYASVLFYHALVVMIPVILCTMVIILTGRLGIASPRGRSLSLLLFAALELFILTNPITGAVFSYDYDNGYRPGPGFFVIFFFGMAVLIHGCFYMGRHREKTRPVQRISIYLFTGITFISCFIQAVLFPGLPVLCFGFTLSVLIIYIAASNTDAFTDQRTGLFSREGLSELQKELYLEKKRCSILCFTFANYNIIKTTYGDEIMIPCLSAIADFLKGDVCRRDVYPFYIHNGRFLLLKNGLYDFTKERALINARFLKPWSVFDNSFRFSPAHAYISSEIKMSRIQEVHTLINKALSEALENGPFSFVSIDEDTLYETRHEIKIRKALEKALDNDELEVWFQPIWSPAANRITSAEALVRVRDDELGIIYPDEFIKTAETNGRITKLGQQVYKRVCEFIATHDIRKYGLDYIEVNLSPIQCLNEHLSDELIAIRKNYGISSRLINLEITETAASDSPIMMENMLRLSQDGFTFSLDDYGTGYSNLMNMLSLPLSIIKIDKSIVKSYFDQSFALAAGGEGCVPSPTEGNTENSILEDLIPMFQGRGLKVVCEGVETNQMVRVLEELGCDYMQGFYFSKPLMEDDFLEYLKTKDKSIGL